MRILLIWVFVVSHAWAQTEKAESNLDLRGHSTVLSIEKRSSDETITIERNGTGDYFLVYQSGSKAEKRKLGRMAAESLDQKFAGVFLKLQYEMSEDPSDCRPSWSLHMRAESQNVCSKNDQKNQEIAPFFDELKKIL